MADFELLYVDNDFGFVAVFVLIDGKRTEYVGEIAILPFSMRRTLPIEVILIHLIY